MWKEITDLDQLEEIKNQSFNSKVAIFKHSTSCGISRMVLRNFEADIKAGIGSETKLYFLDLLKYRPISNAIAVNFEVTHQSPQLIVLQNGIAIHDSSHHSIDSKSLA